MNKLIPLAALLSAFGGTAAVAAVAWPASCTSDSCVNSQPNNVNTRTKGLDNRTFSKTVVVSHKYEFSQNNNILTLEACGTPNPNDARPFKGWAISGGLNISGHHAGQWQIVSSGPPTAMNSWPVDAHNPDYVGGDALPKVTVFAICLK